MSEKAPSRPAIFINYRRADCAAAAEFLAVELRVHFGDDQVFFDTRSMAPGAVWPDEIRRVMEAARVFVVCIGRSWHTVINNQTGVNRLDEAGDWVRQELCEAKKREPGHVIPVLVDGCTELPEKAITARDDIAYLKERSFHIVRAGAERATSIEVLAARIQELGVPKRSPPPAAAPEMTPPTDAHASPAGTSRSQPRAGSVIPTRLPRWSWLVLAGGLTVASLLVLESWPGARPANGSVESTDKGRGSPVESPRNGPAPTKPREIVARLGLDMVRIEPGSFQMGSKDDTDASADEQPVRTVTFAIPFWLSRTEVTNAQYRLFVDATRHPAPGSWSDAACNGDDQPVFGISWQDAHDFCEWAGLRLPTEAEWEYACRAGTRTPFAFGTTIATDQANYDGRFPYDGGAKGSNRARPVAVGTLRKNPWGLCDMHGNVWEFCEDWFGNYQAAPTDGSAQQVDHGGHQRVRRGGAWNDGAGWCRSAARLGWAPDNRSDHIGFRPASSSQ